jgi:ubiquinone/menaquinone biosynthesis C-methylase UbiE
MAGKLGARGKAQYIYAMTLMETVQHSARQAARFAWYGTLYAETKRRTEPSAAERAFKPTTPPPKSGALTRALFELWRQDLNNIRQGIYKAPLARSPLPMLGEARAYLESLEGVQKRRKGRISQEPAGDEALRKVYPRYYLQNFHYQEGGWLSEDSARLYDTQVETLFTGAADAMRRQALPYLLRAARGRDPRNVRILDLACGTGSFSREIKHNLPVSPLWVMDLSPVYLLKAQAALAEFSRWQAVQGFAEAIPMADESLDAVSCVYLFHELPPKMRAPIAAEMARVLKPGGTLVFVDSIQMGDRPELDRLVEVFPVSFHEPYYRSYAKEDLTGLFLGAGLRPRGETSAYLSKVLAFQKPGAQPH